MSDVAMQKIGNLKTQCTLCELVLDIEVYGYLVRGEDGYQYVRTHSDTSDVWLHMFTDHPEACE